MRINKNPDELAHRDFLFVFGLSEQVADVDIGTPRLVGVVQPMHLERDGTDDAIAGIHEACAKGVVGVFIDEQGWKFGGCPAIVDHRGDVVLLEEIVAYIQTGYMDAFHKVGKVGRMVQADEW